MSTDPLPETDPTPCSCSARRSSSRPEMAVQWFRDLHRDDPETKPYAINLKPLHQDPRWQALVVDRDG